MLLIGNLVSIKERHNVIPMRITKALALISIALLAVNSVLTFACSSDLDCQFGAKCTRQTSDQVGVCSGGNPHQHNDKKHREQIILDSHEFNSKTCSYDANCEPGWRCDLRWGFHKGVCVRAR